MLLESLVRFYDENHEYAARFVAFTSRDSPLSLRMLDWLVTNYAKKHNVSFQIRIGDKETNFNVFLEYKAQLRAYSKRFFDPFCRRERVEIVNALGEKQVTTVAQMCFFRWAFTTGIVDYALQNKEAIEEDMAQVIKATDGAASKAAKRQELTKAAIKSCTKTFCHITVQF